MASAAFTPFTLREMTLVVSPMLTYRGQEDGMLNEHLYVRHAARAVGAADYLDGANILSQIPCSGSYIILELTRAMIGLPFRRTRLGEQPPSDMRQGRVQ